MQVNATSLKETISTIKLVIDNIERIADNITETLQKQKLRHKGQQVVVELAETLRQCKMELAIIKGHLDQYLEQVVQRTHYLETNRKTEQLTNTYIDKFLDSINQGLVDNLNTIIEEYNTITTEEALKEGELLHKQIQETYKEIKQQM